MTLREEISANYPKLQKMALSLLRGDRELSEDVLHDTLEKALIYEDVYQKDGNFFSWIYCIMKNVHHNTFRDLIRGREKNIRYLDNLNFSFEMKKLGLDTHIQKEKVFAQLKNLPDTKQDVLYLYLLNFTKKDIAYILGIPEGTVKSRLYYSIKKLKKLIEVA